MKASKACLALSFVVGMAMVPVGHAGQITGNLVSLSVTSPDYPTLETTLDLAQPGIVGDLNIFVQTDLSSVQNITGSVVEDYHAVQLNVPDGVSSTMYYPHSVYYLSGGESNTYDPVTRTLSLHDVQTSFGAEGAPPFCIGSIGLCNAVYEVAPSLGLTDLILVFDEALQNVTGIATFSHTMANGTVISGEYNFTGTPSIFVAPVPVPAAGWLLGSGLIGLAGVVRRRRISAEV